MMRFTALKLGAVQRSVIVGVIISERQGAGSERLVFSLDRSLAGNRQTSNASGLIITRATRRSISSRSASRRFGLRSSSNAAVAWQADVGGFFFGLLAFRWFDPPAPPYPMPPRGRERAEIRAPTTCAP
jgi:hypothetical protein